MIFSPMALSVGQEGIAAEVLDTLDYGKEKYLKCSVDGSVVYVKIDDDVKATSVNLAVDTAKVNVYSPDIDLRLI